MSKRPDPIATDLTWDSLRYTVQAKNTATGKVEPKCLLKGVSGTARNSRTLAVMGPSGAGKSTFLNAISGRVALGKGMTLEGTAYLNDTLLDAKYKPLLSYVAQDDIVMGKNTVREALTFSYRMRSGASAEEAVEVVNEMLERLSLTKCADTLLGVPGLLKGVSGGEKKRTNIGSELINNPMILLLDEPTTGLDSVNALRVGQLIKQLAKEDKRTVICTIHSPSSELFNEFDDLLLLAKGSVVYHGAVADAPGYFASIGHGVPQRVNPSEHFMRLLQAPPEELDQIIDSWAQHAGSSAAKENLSINRTPTAVSLTSAAYDQLARTTKGATAGVEMALLTERALKTTMRDPAGTFGKLTQVLFFGILVAAMYADLAKDDDGVTDRAGALFFLTLNMTFMNVLNALTTFAPERAVFMQEQSNASYSAFRYYISKVIAELPLSLALPTLYVCIYYFALRLSLSAVAFFNYLAVALVLTSCANAFGLFAASLFPSPEIGMSITPVLLMPLLIVGGLFANTERLEPYWVWLNYLSFPRYAYKAAMVNEFEHIEDLCVDGNCRFTNGEEVIKFYGFDKSTDTVWFCVLMMLVLMFAFQVLGAVALYVQGRSRRSTLVFAKNFHHESSTTNAVVTANEPVERETKNKKNDDAEPMEAAQEQELQPVPPQRPPTAAEEGEEGNANNMLDDPAVAEA